jgi:hypothetical protein
LGAEGVVLRVEKVNRIEGNTPWHGSPDVHPDLRDGYPVLGEGLAFGCIEPRETGEESKEHPGQEWPEAVLHHDEQKAETRCNGQTPSYAQKPG